MKKLMTITMIAIFGLGAYAANGAEGDEPEVTSLRGITPLNEEPKAPEHKQWQRDRDPIPREFVQQPPLIPHRIDSYRITAKYNKCLSCHSWSKYRDVDATKVSLTHFKNREGKELADISPRRYFCTQCHIPQTEAKPLVENTFKPVKAVTQK